MLTSDACGRSVIGQGPPDYGIHLPAHIQSFVANLLARGFPVWLIGPQAAELSSQQPIPAVDPLVVFDDNEFKSPWPSASDGVIKGGSLTSWKWQEMSDREGSAWPTSPFGTDCR